MEAQDRLYTVMNETPVQIMSRALPIWFPDARNILDVTYGHGKFWLGEQLENRLRAWNGLTVYGTDLDPARALTAVADFQHLPFRDGKVDLIVFDPPFHTDMGHATPSVMGARFGTFATIPDLQEAVQAGCREAWRVARLGVIAKVQDYIHASRAVWISDWLRGELGEPYDVVHQVRKHKITSPMWTRQLSAWRNHATYWAFRKDGPIHKAR